jgi:hypothetical protein
LGPAGERRVAMDWVERRLRFERLLEHLRDQHGE